MSLFHYTDVNGIMGILKTQELWLTDIRYLNDSAEYLHGIEIFNKLLESEFEKNTIGKDTKSLILSAIEALNNSICVCSFSKKKDLLSQWRGYGKYAIEFDEKVISEIDPIFFRLSDCIYKKEDQHDKVMELINPILKSNTPKGVFISNALKHFTLIASLKNEGFGEEDESRIIGFADDEENNYCFRERNGIIIPYLKMKFPVRAIKRIWIGPMENQALAYKSMEMYIKSLKEDKENDFSRIYPLLGVGRSIISFRG
ncbi:DUF2971 domain-containing protein [Desulforegula conservatrix]|uniref:DUF2971 domain-containing protein n=1 Tax=Desulforegula conservatrix TaxID=153026 RepID=UPI0004279AB6|nr:DUF2971 domain-containing protein [Desulforegula conservatrix]